MRITFTSHYYLKKKKKLGYHMPRECKYGNEMEGSGYTCIKAMRLWRHEDAGRASLGRNKRCENNASARAIRSESVR